MEIKKSPKADLQNKRGLLLEIGLVVALGLVIGAFAYTPKEKRINKVDLAYGPIEEEMNEITRQDQKPTEPPKKIEVDLITDLLQVVTNDTKIATDMSFNDFDQDTEIVTQVKVKDEAADTDEIFMKVEIGPRFQGASPEESVKVFRDWVQKRLDYPQIAAENNIQGTVTLKFIIEKDGSLSNIEVLASPDRSLSEEAIKVLKQSPKWTPGRQRNQPARVIFTLPVQFKLNN